jgi:hypothetical protein
MRPKQLEVIFAAGMVFCLVGCATPPADHAIAPPVASAEEFPLGSLKMDLRSFRTLDELRASSKPHDETERFYLFEKNQAKAAVVVATWGSGDHWNAVIVYSYDHLRGQWTARSVWNTEARNVRVVFDKRQGTIHVRSGKGVAIFSVQVEALQARRTRDW